MERRSTECKRLSAKASFTTVLKGGVGAEGWVCLCVCVCVCVVFCFCLLVFVLFCFRSVVVVVCARVRACVFCFGLLSFVLFCFRREEACFLVSV